MPETPDDLVAREYLQDLLGREYLRVSRDKSGRERSNDEQHDDNARDAEGRWGLGDPYSDVGSASRYARKARGDFDQLLADLSADASECRRGCRFDADVLVLWESSRGSRRVGEWVDLLELCEQRGVRISVTTHGRLYDPANPRDRRTLLEDAVDSEYESGKTSQRVRRTTAAVAAARRPHGRRLYGYERVYDTRTGALLGQRPHPTEAPVVRRIFSMYLSGHGIRTIATTLRGEGLRRPNGPWNEVRVGETLGNPSYAGRRTWKGEDMGQADPEVWPPLIDPEVFDQVQERRRMVRERAQPGQGPKSRLLSGVARCGLCAERMIARPDKGRPVYQCRGCRRVLRDLRKLDDYVTIWLLARFAQWLTDPATAPPEDVPDPAVDAARARAASLKAELEAAQEDMLAERMSAQAYARLERDRLPKIAAAEREAKRAVVPLDIDLPSDPGALEAWWYDTLTAEQRREVVMHYIAAVIVQPTGRIGRRKIDQGDYTKIERRR